MYIKEYLTVAANNKRGLSTFTKKCQRWRISGNCDVTQIKNKAMNKLCAIINIAFGFVKRNSFGNEY